MAIDEAYDKLLVMMKGGLVEVKVKRKGRAAMVYKRDCQWGGEGVVKMQ